MLIRVIGSGACATLGDATQVKMASSISGMFPGQQLTGSHPVGGPGAPGQPGFPMGAARAQGNNTLVDELEASFEVGCSSYRCC